jgi:hypothetical protein
MTTKRMLSWLARDTSGSFGNLQSDTLLSFGKILAAAIIAVSAAHMADTIGTSLKKNGDHVASTAPE